MYDELKKALDAMCGAEAPMEVAEDYGTPEGAVKAAETRKAHGGGGSGFVPQPTKRNPSMMFPMEGIAAMARHDPTVAKKHLSKVLGQSPDIAKVYRYPSPKEYQGLVDTPFKRNRLRQLGYMI